MPQGKGNVPLHLIVVPDFEQPYAAISGLLLAIPGYVQALRFSFLGNHDWMRCDLLQPVPVRGQRAVSYEDIIYGEENES